jgi:hypothetical protein
MYAELFGESPVFSIAGRAQRRQYMTVKICAPCNQWGNTEFEVPARPLLTALHAGKLLQLTASDTRILSLYAIKHMMLASLWAEPVPERHLFHNPLLTSADYRRLRSRMRPPPYSKVWLGVIRDADPDVEQEAARAVPELALNPISADSRYVMGEGSFVVPINFGRLLMVWATVAPKARQASAEPFLRRCEVAGLLLRTWPGAAAVFWPPPISLDVTTQTRWNNRLHYVA